MISEVDLNSRKDLTFRFRSADKILEYKELENTEIYFCPFEEEDDVLEGALNLYWQADEVLWDNFFAHYFIVYQVHYSLIVLTDEDKREIPKEILWRQVRTKYNMEGLIYDFLEQDTVRCVKKLAMANNHKVSSEELCLYLKYIHSAAITVAAKVVGVELQLPDRKLDDNWEEMIKKINWEKMQKDGIFHILDKGYQKYRQGLVTEKCEDWKRWLLLDFPDCYFSILKEMVFPKWYIASFCKSCTDTRNWAQYGDYNRGICLIFRTHQGTSGRGIRLKTCNSFSTSQGRIISNSVEPLKEVQYTSSFPEINFFEMLGSIPGKMVEEWYHGDNKNCSKYYVDRNSVERKEWQSKYWKMFEFLITNKGEDWHDLAEERIVLENLFFEGYENKDNRKIKYDFEELHGIIWGCATTEENKKIIREQIGELCKKYGRNEFQFYQVVKKPASREFVIEKEL